MSTKEINKSVIEAKLKDANENIAHALMEIRSEVNVDASELYFLINARFIADAALKIAKHQAHIESLKIALEMIEDEE